jgi:hypothetical protein
MDHNLLDDIGSNGKIGYLTKVNLASATIVVFIVFAIKFDFNGLTTFTAFTITLTIAFSTAFATAFATAFTATTLSTTFSRGGHN